MATRVWRRKSRARWSVQRKEKKWVEMVAGKGEVENVAGNHKGEIKMDEARTCPKCNRTYHCPPATSKIDESDICPICGVMEALETVPVGLEEKEKIKRQIVETERKAGRIDLLPGE